MKFERFLLSFLAVLGGLIVASVAFYFYQSSKVIPPSQIKSITQVTPTPTSAPVVLTIDSPQDLSVVDNKIVIISGHTDPQSTIIISTGTTDLVINPTNVGSFSTTVTLGNDENHIHILAVNPQGQEVEKVLTITYSTESF